VSLYQDCVILGRVNKCESLRPPWEPKKDDSKKCSELKADQSHVWELPRPKFPLNKTSIKEIAHLLDAKAVSVFGISSVEGGFTGEEVGFLENVEKDYGFSFVNVTQVCETGFNSGKSSALWLIQDPKLKVVSFDLGNHGYSKTSQQMIWDIFDPSRHEMVVGDSLETIPAFAKSRAWFRCDLMYVDGGRTQLAAHSDIVNFRPFASENSILIVDDCGHSEDPVGAAFHGLVRKKELIDPRIYAGQKKGWCVARYNTRQN
jgi:hypothetical protein